MAIHTDEARTETVATHDEALADTKKFLEAMWLLPRSDEVSTGRGFKEAFTGPPQSVALIEAGATALTKWWAVGLGGSVAVLWGSIASWWRGQGDQAQVSVIWAAAIVSAGALLALGYIIGSDVRGRSQAAVATIEARISMARAMVHTDADAAVDGTAAGVATKQLVPLTPPLIVESISKEGADEAGWVAVALHSDGETVTKYLLTKDKQHEWVSGDQVKVAAAPTPPSSRAHRSTTTSG